MPCKLSLAVGAVYKINETHKIGRAADVPVRTQVSHLVLMVIKPLHGAQFSKSFYRSKNICHMSAFIYCYDALNGTKIWSYATSGEILSSPAVANGKLYVGSFDQNVYCLEALNGDLVWSYNTGGEVWSCPAVAEGRVFVGSHDNNVYCLDALNGTRIWSYATTGWVYSSPCVAGGKVFVGSNDGSINCLDALTGESLWSYMTGGQVRSSPTIVEGNLYVGSTDGRIYAFGASVDFAVKSIALSKTVVGQGYPVYFNVTVENQKCYESPITNLTTYANGTVVQAWNVSGLNPGGQLTLSFSWDTSDWVKGSYIIEAIVDTVSGETDTVDNVLECLLQVQVTVPGDVNGDKTVDIYGAIKLAGAYNNDQSSPNWNPNADINSDDIVDIYDAIILANHYNQHYP